MQKQKTTTAMLCTEPSFRVWHTGHSHSAPASTSGKNLQYKGRHAISPRNDLTAPHTATAASVRRSIIDHPTAPASCLPRVNLRSICSSSPALRVRLTRPCRRRLLARTPARERQNGRRVVDVDGTRTRTAAHTRSSPCRLIGLTTATSSLQLRLVPCRGEGDSASHGGSKHAPVAGRRNHCAADEHAR